MEVHPWISFTYIIVHVKLLMRFLLFLFLLAMEKCEVMCLIDFLIVFCMQDQGKQVSSDGNTSGTIDQRVPQP